MAVKDARFVRAAQRLVLDRHRSGGYAAKEEAGATRDARCVLIMGRSRLIRIWPRPSGLSL